jgi:aspartyl-tRNA(Asn)/glutamyl-tRNA(Gln) amidotransferase subunit A
MCPTSPLQPFRLGEKIVDPIALYACDVLTVAANLAGFCAISLPCGWDRRGLPIGMQLMAPPEREAELLELAEQFQQGTEYHRRLPPGGGGKP